jgi:hypothetical protein
MVNRVDIQEYLEERERQKTARELAWIQHQREKVGVADEELFANQDFDIEDVISDAEDADRSQIKTTEFEQWVQRSVSETCCVLL